MSILSGFEKVKDRILTSTGYKLRSLWTSAQTVEMDDGTVLQDKIESMDTKIDGKAPSSHTHTATQVTGLTPSMAMVSDNSGHPSVSNVTSTELNYLDGVTSNIQNQIDTLNSNLTDVEESVEGLNGKIVKAGSKVITNASNASVSSWGILSNSDVNKILGVTDSVKENTTVLFVNGDSQAFDGIISSYYESGTWVAHFSKPFNPKASVRINYVIAYSKN